MKKAYEIYGTQSKGTIPTLWEFHKEKGKRKRHSILKAIMLKTSQTWREKWTSRFMRPNVPKEVELSRFTPRYIKWS